MGTAPETIDSADQVVASVNGLHITFFRRGDPVHALRGVSLDIRRGEILGLVGESGSGKSALGLTLLGLLRGDEPPKVDGDVNVLGIDMVRAPAKTRRLIRRDKLGAVFQDPMTSLNPTMKIGRQIAEAAGSNEEAARLLDAVGVPDAKRRLESYPHELSGGQRQRVMIAMAIAGGPELVIADEPTTALDVTVQAQVLELIGTLRDEIGCSFLLITHDLGVAAQIADRIAVLYAGRLAEVGTTRDVLQSPSHPYTIGLLHSRLTMRAQRDRPLIALPGEPPDPRTPAPGCPFGPRCTLHEPACDEALPELEPALSGSRAACIRLSEVRKSLQEPSDDLAWPRQQHRLDVNVSALRMRDVHKTFILRSGLFERQRLQALRGVDIDISPGRSVALVGESGCGKSTLLRIAAGLLDADGGSIEAHGEHRPQMVFQDAGASLTPWLTVGEQINERLRAEGMGGRDRARRVAETLRLVGLPAEIGAARPLQLSGGQRQRVALARAVVVPPELLLCDEPTSSLDVSLAATVLNLIGALRRELGLAVLFVTHDLAAARVVADRIEVMYLGKIVESGPVEEVAADPVHPYTKALVAAVPDFGVKRAPVKGEPGNPLSPPPGCPYHPRCPEAIDICSTEVQVLVPFGDRGDREAACVHVKGATWQR